MVAAITPDKGAFGGHAATLLVACTISFLLGAKLSPGAIHGGAGDEASTVRKTTPPPAKKNNGWHQIDVFYGDSNLVAKRVPSGQNWTSQVDQDRTVFHLLNKMKGGFFVDLASNDATFISNTYILESRHDWNGICIEANPKYWHWLSSRPRCQVVGAVVGHVTMDPVTFSFKATGAEFTYYDGGLYGGIAAKDLNKTRGISGTAQKDFVTEKRYTITLSDLFERYDVPRFIDYLSLDVEGAESYIMSNFPFQDYEIKILTVERPGGDLQELLRKHGYVFLKDMVSWGEKLYCHESVLSMLDFDAAGVTRPTNNTKFKENG